MSAPKFRPWIVVAAVVAVIVVNALANTLPIGGLTTGEVSDGFEVFFTPAAYVFSIWGVIYAGLAAFTVYQALPGQRENALVDKIWPYFVLSSLANIAWIFLWHYQQFVWTVPAMLIILGSLVVCYLLLGTGRTRASRIDNWLIRIPFSIYLGWITVATIANVTVLLASLGWEGGPLAPQAWSAIMLVAGGVIASLLALTRGDVPYIMVIAWAYFGVAIKYADERLVSVTAALVATAVVAALGIGVARKERRLPPETV